MVFWVLALDFLMDLDFSEIGGEPERLDSDRGVLYFLTSFSSCSR